VHALYGFARYADEIVDDLGSTLTDAEKASWLIGWGEQFLSDVKSGGSEHPISRAVVDTVRRWDIPLTHIEVLLASTRMDLQRGAGVRLLHPTSGPCIETALVVYGGRPRPPVRSYGLPWMAFMRTSA